MPPRIARSSVQAAAPKSARTKNRKRNLDAYAIASHSLPSKTGVRQNRLGEFLDDGPTQKRRRIVQKDDEEESVEEDVPAKPKRPTGTEGDVEEGSDSEGNEWTLGGLREDDEDSDLDSDGAFGESDEERFAGFTFRGSSSRKDRKPVQRRARPRVEDGDIDLDEDEAQDEEEEDGFGDEGVDLATMLDDEDEELLGGKDTTKQDMGDESASDDDDEEEEEESPSESDSEQDEDESASHEERIARMMDRVEALDSTAQAPQATPQPNTLTTDILLAAAADLDPSARKRLAKTSKNSKPLPAPLPPRQQDRLNRAVASKRAKEQLDRWRDTVIQNRRAEFLSFPLKDPERSEPIIGKDKFILDSAPQNELEENIRKIMEESGMVGQWGDTDEDAGMKSEEVVQEKMPVEEIMRRRAELRRARELLFREEIRAKRIAKIKSKAYRRVHRKERERERRLLGGFDGEEEEEEEEKDRADRRRAEERMSTKHRDSKWARSLRATNRGVWDVEARDSVHEQAKRNEELRRRIAGGDVESGDDSTDEGEDEDARMLEKLDRIQKDGGDGGEVKGLGGMEFMRAADERQRKRNEEDIERLRKEIAGEGHEEEEDAVEDQGLGRAIFGPKEKEKQEPMKQAKRPELEEGDVSEEEEQEAEVLTERSKRAERKQPYGIGKKANAKGTLWTDPNERNAVATSDWLTAPLKASKKDRRRAREVNDRVLIDTTTANPVVKKQTTSKANRKEKADETSWTLVAYKDNSNIDENEGDSGSDPEPSNPMLTIQERNSEYHRRAFAGDDVKAAFDAEKADAVVSEDEREISNHLPGWGSWTGEGLSKSIRKANTRQRHNPLFKTKLPGMKAEDRKDARLENVIVSEKSDRKGRKYKADILPHGFEKREQYERSLRVPMGPEWVTKETFQRNTRPRVVVRPGVVVQAMEKPLL